MTQLLNILVTGATGKQGGAVVQSLLNSNTPVPQFSVIALTRSLKSAKAQSLATQPHVTVVEGNLDDVPAIFAQLPTPLYGVFSVQTAGKAAVEEKQGKDLIDAAIKAGVNHFVYSSVERGGPEKSDIDPTPIPHFISKFNIEKYLLATAVQMEYTIIRPVGFMDNFTPDFFGSAMSSILKLNGVHNRFQLVSAKDIGNLAGLAFQTPADLKGKRISLAGDDLSWAEMDDIFKAVTGSGAPTTYHFIGYALRWALSNQMDWFRDVGFGANVEDCRKLVPGLLGFEKWLREESGFQGLAKR